MSQIYPPTRVGKTAMFREARDNARARGDMNMVCAMDAELAMLEPPESVVPEPLETAVPAKPKRSKRPRCEHGRIVGRCLDCEGEDADLPGPRRVAHPEVV